MGTNITVTASDGFELSAYRADPDGSPRGGVVVIQEIFGVNGHIREVADRYAAAGYLAIAPAVFDRAERGVDLGYTEADIQTGFGFAFGKVDFANVIVDAVAAGRVAAEAGKVGIVGFCFGGLVTAAVAINAGEGFSAASSYYGGNTITLAGQKPLIPLIAHYGERDHFIPMTDVDTIRSGWSDSVVYTYPADHGFNCDQRASFHAQSAAVAQARTFRFFDEHLG